ncbi:MAG: phosphoribosylanthranilate isomerase [Ruminococcaceae bacterium]|nr:phosphoribosylanthranilate isomerase [Oscillospiraceae bacterium]
MKIKLCGIRREEDAEYINEFPPDYAGFVFAESKRKVTLKQAEKLSALLLPSIIKVGVFVNQPLEEMPDFADAISVYQLHGDEDGEYIDRLRQILPQDCEIWKAVRVSTKEDIVKADGLNADKLLLDAFSKNAYGGTGRAFDWELISKARISKPFFTAGGITAENIEKAAVTLKPYGIDLSGGIETNGFKNREKIKQIIEIVDRLRKL